MRSSNKLILMTLSTIALILVAKSHKTIPSEEEKVEMEKLLNHINKPAIKSFQTENGEIFDCTDIHKQLAFDHPLLKNHSVQMKPTNAPEWITSNNISQKAGLFQFLQKGISCPHGTVIVKRTTIQDLIQSQRLKSIGFNSPRHVLTEGNNIDLTGHHFATADYGYSRIYGVKGNINLWDVQVSNDQVSIATMAIAEGPIEHLASISVGWMVNPLLYQDHIHLYTYWTADGYTKTGCYDIKCPGFVQVSKRIPLGVLLQPVSVYGGIQKEMDLSLHQDHATGDWWFVFGGENVGYWPKSLFIGSGLVKGAHLASWGGQVYSPVKEKSPVMGSGHFPEEGFGKAAFVNGIQIIDGSGEALIPQIYTIKTHESTPMCYTTKYVHDDDEPWIRAIYYGGPGGCIG
ncbi:Protein neprosin [Cardamine amara subsp. amara]|uniref:Protein neprosin n=1 Tax=Cardamine amara subsp. amara TaxID=228776 RepID=A0ABD0Z7V0_CARAN